MWHATRFQSREVFRCFFPPTIMATRTATPGNDFKGPFSKFSGHRQKRTLRSLPVIASGESGSYRNWRFRKSLVLPLAR
jgi:hypothetical protein